MYSYNDDQMLSIVRTAEALFRKIAIGGDDLSYNLDLTKEPARMKFTKHYGDYSQYKSSWDVLINADTTQAVIVL